MTAALTIGVARRRMRDTILQTAARGAGLIGVAVLVGILLLQVIDNGSSGVGGGVSGTPTTGGTGATSTTAKSNVKPPAEVRVQVLNGSGVSGAAKTRSDALRGLGYPIAALGNAELRTGTAVQCRAGFEKEAEALVANVGGTPAPVIEGFPDPAPAGVDLTNTDCLVVLGQ